MRMIILALMAVSTHLAGCEAETPTPADVATGEAEGLAPAPTPPAPAAGAPAILQPIVRAEWDGRLEPGAGCNLSRGGQEYVVVTAGDGVAKIDGRVVDLTDVPTDFDAVTVPGRYSGGGATVALTPAPDLGEGSSADGQFTKPVRVEVASAGRVERFEAAWTCGS